jgi:flagellar motor switch protein FliM
MVTRTMTEIERNILKGILTLTLRDLNEVWQQVTGAKMALYTMETNPQLIQIIPPNEVVILISFEIHIGEASGMMNLCIPSLTLEPISGKFEQDLFSETKKVLSSKQFEDMKANLMKVKLHLECEIGKTAITADDMVNLKVGDIIKLDKRIYEDVLLKIVNIPKFFVKIGRVHNKKAIQITGKHDLYDRKRSVADFEKKKMEFRKSDIS